MSEQPSVKLVVHIPCPHGHLDRHRTCDPEKTPGKAVGTELTDLGWSDCGHDDWRPAVVLDPFAGSGTTLAVATGHGHDAIGIDLDERNYQLALERVGPMLLGPPERVEGFEA